MANFLTEVIDAQRDIAISNRNVQRTNLNFKEINSKLSEHTKTLAAVTPVIANNAIPSNPTAVVGTNGGKVVDNVLLDVVTVQYTSPNPIGSFGGVFLVAKNYNGSPTLVKVGEDTFHGAAGATQSFITVLQRTNEAVTFFVVPKTASEVTPIDWTTCPSFVLTLDGLVSAPPAPTFAETLIATPTGYEFAFTQVVAAGTVIDSYKVYRNTSFSSSGATVIRTFKHDQTNAGSPITVQDVSPDGVPYYYYVSAVNTSGLESAKASAQAGTVFATTPLTMKGAPVVITPAVSGGNVTNGGGLGQWTAGLNVGLPGVVDFDVLSTGGIVDVLLYSSTGGVGPNGYLLRFDGRTGHPAGQILKITNGTWANIGAAIAANNAVALSGWHSVTVRVTGSGQFDIFVDGIWNTTAIDITFTLTGATYYGNEVIGNSTIAPPAFINKTLDNLPDGGVYLRSGYVSGDAFFENGNFEASSTILPPPGYTLYANTPTLAYDTTTQFSGARSIQITSPGGGGGGIRPIKFVACRPGDVFFASVRAKLISGVGAADLSISFRDANLIGIGGADVTTSSSSWTLLQQTLTAPAGTVFATFEIFARGANTVVEFDEHYVRCVRNLDTEVGDGSTRFAQTAGGLTYRPTSNPLTATDAGANAAVSIAAFTMRCTGHSDVSVNSGSVAGLSYNTLYYIYYDDPALVGAGVAYQATTTKETAINGGGRFFVGSIATPAATAAATVGNNDGGVGAQGGGTSVFLFGAGVGNITPPATTIITGSNTGNCFDGDTATAATLNKVVSLTGTADGNIVVSGMSPSSAPWQSLTLNVRTGVTISGASITALVQYSLDGGATFTNIYSTSVTRAAAVNSVAIPVKQNLAQLRVKVDLSTPGSVGSATLSFYEAWVVGVL
jgi:hypothetical protein